MNNSLHLGQTLSRYCLIPVVTAVVKNTRHGVHILGLRPSTWELADPKARALIEQ